MNSIRNFIRGFSEILLPNLCVFCDSPLSAGIHYVCSRCWLRLPVFPERDGVPFRALRGVIDHLWIGWDYDHQLRRIIHLFKYHQRPDFAELLAREFLKVFPDPASIFSVDVIVPVPIHPARRRSRGFNQSERLAEAIRSNFKIDMEAENVKRKLNTPSQTLLTRKDRWRSVSDAFTIALPVQFRDKRVLIIDDLATSGATLHALAGQIRTCQPRSIDAAVLSSPYMEGQAI